MQKIIQILKDVNDGYDYSKEERLFSDHKLDSFDLIGLLSELKEAYQVEIPAFMIQAEHFDSAKKIFRMIETLRKGK